MSRHRNENKNSPKEEANGKGSPVKELRGFKDKGESVKMPEIELELKGPNGEKCNLKLPLDIVLDIFEDEATKLGGGFVAKRDSIIILSFDAESPYLTYYNKTDISPSEMEEIKRIAAGLGLELKEDKKPKD